MERQSLYFLTDETGATYYEDNGVVKKSATELKPLPNSPDGWKDKVVNYGRNTTYFGIFRSFTIPLKFIKSGAHILRQVLFQLGIEAIVSLVILRLNKTNGKYQSFYKGEIDFSKAQSNRDTFQVNVLEGGFPKYLKAYEGTTYEIPLEGDGVVDLKMDGLTLKKTVKYRTYEESIHDDAATVPFAVTSEEGTSFGIITGDSPSANAVGFDNTTNNDRWIIKNVGDTTISCNLKGTLKFATGTNSGGVYTPTFHFFLQNNNSVNYTLFYGVVAENTDYEQPFEIDFPLAVGERVFVIFNASSNDVPVGYEDSEFTLTFNTKFKQTTIKAIKPSKVAETLIKNMAGAGFTINSPLLDNCDIYLTCGDAIRGIAGAKLKTNWKDFFASYNRNLCIGMSYTDSEVQVKERAAYYQSGVIYDLGEVKNAVFSIEESLLFNSIKAGYANKDYDDVNGREEFNTTSEFKAPITRVNKVFDLTAPYRADMYGIEFIRINLEGKTTTDNSGDNDIFMIVVERDPVANDGTFRLKRDSTLTVDGLIDPASAFNIQLSPKRIINAHGAWIRSMMWPYDGKFLTFQTTDKNSSLKTTKGLEVIEEKADIQIGKLTAPYMLPISVKLETIVPDDLLNIMDANSYGLFKFTYQGKEFKMWAEDCKQKSSDNASQEWKGILSADNDLNNLIYG
jgi:hypothetical protein